MTPVFMHIRPLIDGKQSQQGMTVAMKFLDANNVVTCYNNATTLIVGLSATKMATGLSPNEFLRLQAILDHALDNDNDYKLWNTNYVQVLNILADRTRGDAFNKKIGCEVALQNLESKPLGFTLEQWKTKVAEMYEVDWLEFNYIDFKSISINDLCDTILSAKTFGDLPSKMFRALIYSEIAEYAYKHLSMFKPKQLKPYCVIPDFVL